MSLNLEALSRAATEARGLAMDAVQASKSGHLGLPLGCAEIAAVLYGQVLQHNPDEPRWIGRDYFILSAGHGSMLLYAWLHLSGYDLSLEDVKAFRQLHSKTPGHPEFFETPGVECTTGPLGQGVGNAVGVAMAAKMAAARFNTAEHPIFDQHVICLAGDGCLQEGVSAEASAFAAHFGLDNLILIYDSNAVTLDAMAAATQSEDTAKRYVAYGFDVQTIDGNDMPAILKALNKAKKRDNGKPQMIIARTLIGKGIPEVAGTSKAHGEAGVKFVDEARRNLGLPAEHFYVSPETREYFAKHKKALIRQYRRWEKTYQAWRAQNAEKAQQLDDAIDKKVPANLLEQIPHFAADAKLATRKAGSEALQPIAQAMPFLISGSADLHGSTLNYIEGGEDFTRSNALGRNIHFGIREHGMCAIMNGVSYHGVFRASGATFLVFADYCRAAIRLAALAKLPNIYIFTHDSIGVGEDGPTHQPVETVSGLRVIPQLDVIRPADPEETAGAFAAAAQHTDGPTLLALTRQAVPMLNEIDVQPAPRRRGPRWLHREARKRRARVHSSFLRERIAARARGREGAGRGDARGLDALLRTLRAATRGISRGSFASDLSQAGRDRGGRARHLVPLRRARWQGCRPASLWPERAGRRGHEGTRDRCTARDRRRALARVIASRVPIEPAAVAAHYDELDRFYRDVWGEHVHHGLWLRGDESRAEAVINLTERVAREAGEARAVVDIGCGYGATARWLAERGAEVTAMTLSPAQFAIAVERNEGRANPQFLLGDWLENDLADEMFDAAIAIESSEHMPSKPEFFRQAARVLRPGGRLVICAWLAAEDPSPRAERWLLEPICREGRMPELGSASEYETLAGKAGFSLRNFDDITRQVERTWPSIVRILLAKFLTEPRYLRFLFNPHEGNRVFALTILRIWIAYRVNAMRYGLFTFVKA